MNPNGNIKNVLLNLSNEKWFCDMVAKSNKLGNSELFYAGTVFGIPIYVESEQNVAIFGLKARAFFGDQFSCSRG